jgi:hypothetical protein
VNLSDVNQPTTSSYNRIPIPLQSSPTGFRFDPDGRIFRKNHAYIENSYASRVSFSHSWGSFARYHVLLSMDNHACWSLLDVSFSGRYSSRFLSMARINSATSLDVRMLPKC